MSLLLNDFDRRQAFIDGKSLRSVKQCNTGIASAVASGFRSIRNILAQGGKSGHLQFADGGNGWYTVAVTDGPFKGHTGIYNLGSPCCYFDSPGGKSVTIEV